jgi:hypothetical protein
MCLVRWPDSRHQPVDPPVRRRRPTRSVRRLRRHSKAATRRPAGAGGRSTRPVDDRHRRRPARGPPDIQPAGSRDATQHPSGPAQGQHPALNLTVNGLADVVAAAASGAATHHDHIQPCTARRDVASRLCSRESRAPVRLEHTRTTSRTASRSLLTTGDQRYEYGCHRATPRMSARSRFWLTRCGVGFSSEGYEPRLPVGRFTSVSAGELVAAWGL